MKPAATSPSRPGIGPYEFFMLCLCIWALLSLGVSTFARIPDSAAACST